jgi:hypothetical protein
LIKENPNFLILIKYRKDEMDLANLSESHRRRSSKEKAATSSQTSTLPANLLKEYKTNFDTINNIIIFTEFIKEFIAIIVHKFHFENIVENLYELYSNMLDNYYINNEEQNSQVHDQ